jgi:hypothetical protein
VGSRHHTGKAPEGPVREAGPVAEAARRIDRQALYERRAVEGAEGAARVETTDSARVMIGDPAAKRFHRPECALLAQVADDQRVRFVSYFDAVDAGYSPCKECAPSSK